MLIREGVRSFRAVIWRVLLISASLLLPCFWHKRIEAGDLPSHTYNAWLSQLIARGQAPGLYIESRWDNVLSDIALAKLGALTGFVVAEHIVVALAVLIFFWGAFTLISAASFRAAWTLVPGIGMIAYGWTFYAGFLNYYLSLGFAFWAVALFWRGRGIDLLAGAVLALLSLLAHPMGLVILVGLAIYLRLSEILRGWIRWLLFLVGCSVVLGLHCYVLRLKNAFWHTWKDFLYMNGTDQLSLFATRYQNLSIAVLGFGGICFLHGVVCEWRKHLDFRRPWRAPLELWLLLLLTALMIPETILVPDLSPVPFGKVISRITSVTGVLALCVVGSIKPRTWHLAGLGICALVFFTWTYQDTGILNDIERQAEILVRSLPYGRRVTSTLTHPGWRLPIVNHSVDRACIRRCFAYDNYEPSTAQFRIRVHQGSPVVTDSVKAHSEMQRGSYTVRKENLPMAQIYQCDEKNLTKLCIRELSAGEQNGSIGHRPPSRF
jgi:hypothetical protein